MLISATAPRQIIYYYVQHSIFTLAKGRDRYGFSSVLYIPILPNAGEYSESPEIANTYSPIRFYDLLAEEYITFLHNDRQRFSGEYS